MRSDGDTRGEHREGTASPGWDEQQFKKDFLVAKTSEMNLKASGEGVS